jgi:hypothetical protein
MFSETSALTRAKRCKITKDTRHYYHREYVPEDSVLRPSIVPFSGEANQEIIDETIAHSTVTDRHSCGGAVTGDSFPSAVGIPCWELGRLRILSP